MPKTAELDAIFFALADPARRAILERLSRGDANVGVTARPLRLNPSSVSKHLKVLESAGLIERRLRGREHWLSLTPHGWKSAADWMMRYGLFWRESLDRLDELIAGQRAPVGPGSDRTASRPGGED